MRETTDHHDTIPDAPGGAAPEPDWAALRREFPALERFAFVNIAQKAPVPRSTEAALRSWLDDTFETVGEAAFSMSAIEATRDSVARTFGMESKNTALIKNTSEGMNIVAQGYPLVAGDNVVISSEEHENNTFPWRHARSRGVELRIARPDASGRVRLDAYAPLVDARTRVLSVAWVAYGNGYRSDLRALGAFCSERGILLVVDGIQAVGVLADRIDSLGADVVVAGGHKAQFSLAGAGFLYASDAAIGAITPPYAAKFSYTSNDRTQDEPQLAPDARRFEYGNPNFVGCWVQRRSAEFLHAIGLAKIEARVESLTTLLIDEADRRGIGIRTPRPWQERAGIVSFALASPAGEVVRRLRTRGVVVSEKDGHVRASVHFYNDESDIERLLDALGTQ